MIADLGFDESFQRSAEWKLKFAFSAKRCFISGRRIWLEKAYLGVRMITGPADPVYLQYWHSKDEHLLWCLKG